MTGKKRTGELTQELMGASPELLEYNERTAWRERMIIAKAKSFALKALVIGGMIALCICAWKAEDPYIIVSAVMPIISGVLAFFAGRSSKK